MVIVKHCIAVAGEQLQLIDHDKIMQHERGALQVESPRHKEERTIHSRDHGCQYVRGTCVLTSQTHVVHCTISLQNQSWVRNDERTDDDYDGVAISCFSHMVCFVHSPRRNSNATWSHPEIMGKR